LHVTSGATKGNITDHFSVAGNRADVNAKESTQETLVSLIGMALGVWLTKFLHSLEILNEATTCDNNKAYQDGVCNQFDEAGVKVAAQTISWTIFLFLTFVHVWANYIGVQRLHLRTLNRERAYVTLQPVIEECAKWVVSSKRAIREGTPSKVQESEMNKVVQTSIDKLASPKDVSESLWKSIVGMFWEGDMHLGIRIRDLVSVSWSNDCHWSQVYWDCLRDEFHGEMYMIDISHVNRKRRSSISVMMRLGATERDELKAFLHAYILMRCMETELCNKPHETLAKKQSNVMNR
jgi:hypothetical protein